MTGPAGAPPVDPARLRERLVSPWPHVGGRGVAIVVAAVAVYTWGLAGTDVQPRALVDGLPGIGDFVRRLFPPTWKAVDSTLALGGWSVTVPLPEVIFAIIETLQMAIVGTSAAVVLALPFGLLAARNTSPHPLIYQAMRLVLNSIRAVPDIVFALMFVAAVGLGPFSGALALAVGAVGVMGKMYAEAIESIDRQQVQAVAATGAGRLHVFWFAVIPQALPLVASYALLLFEQNVRSATILGIVGAGGVGFLLSRYMSLFQYQHLTGALVVIIVAVTAIDRVSDFVRRRLL